MHRLVNVFALLLGVASVVHGQTTLHLRDEASTINTSDDQLTLTQPDPTAVAIQGTSLKGLSGTVIFKTFETQSGVPNIDGVIAANASISFALWMKTSVSSGTYVAYAALVDTNPTYGGTVCFGVGSTAISTTLTKETFSCTPGISFPVYSSDRFQLQVGVSISKSPTKSAIPEVDVEGSSDSTVVIPGLVAPNVSSLSPPSGDIGTTISINGSSFGPAQQLGTITFNGVQATPSYWHESLIQAPVPNNASTGPVIVTTGGLQSNAVTFTVPPPSLTSLSPNSGSIGTAITINGSHFGPSQGNSTVTFNGVAATPTNWSVGSITAPVPTNATDGPVVVTVGGAASNSLPFTVMPGITSLSPPSGAVGTSVTISGTSFGSTQSTSTVTFNGLPATPTSWNAGTIVAPVPAGASTGPVIVTVNSGTASKPSNSVTFTVPLYISAVTPTSGGIRAPVSIRGSSFGSTQGTSTVTFNGTAATPSLWNNSQIIAPVPSGATTGTVTVTVNGTAVNGGTFTVYTTGSISGTITRASDGSIVSGAEIDALQSGIVQTSTTSASNGAYSFSSLTPGTYNLRVSASGYGTQITGPVGVVAGASATVNVSLPSPSITGLSPSSGIVGTSVTIGGLSFGPTISNSTVTFNGVPATPSQWSNTAITVPVPSGATTGPVVVTVAGAGSNGVNFTIGTGTIAGTVTRASDSSPISGALVQALQANVVISSASTVSNGTYSIPNLTPGSYDVVVSASSYGSILQTGNSVAASATTTVNASLTTPGTVSGKVTQSDGVTAISGASVTAFQGADTLGTTTTDSNGNYSIATLSAGAYNVQASAAGYNAQTQTGVTVTSGTVTTANFSLAGQKTIVYDYDELGRLVGVTDSTGNTATYSYDAVGNILSITNTPSTQVSIITFDPQSGPVGTAVTISGTGFSTSAGQNTVKFNGTASSVTSSSATQIVTTVPTGATTGVIAVTAPGGTANSNSSFTVTAGSGAPTISNFNPNMGTPGTGVTITGTNFDTAIGNDRTQFNTTFADVTSGTTTSLGATVPNYTASGHITVSTTVGKAVSSQDFFIPFGSHAVTDIGVTGRMSFGSTQTVSISTAGKIALILFDASQGQRASVQMSNGTFSTCTLYLFDPNGNQLANATCSGASNFMAGQNLHSTGTYTLGIDPSGTTGSVNLTLNNAPDLTGSLVVGKPVTVTFAIPGQRALYTFSGTAGESLDLTITNYSTMVGQGCNSNVAYSVLNPNGSTLAAANICNYPINTILPISGTYTVLLDPAGLTGLATIDPSNDITGTITVGTPLTTTINIPGQRALYTFSGTAGESLDLTVTNYSTMVGQGCNSNVAYSVLNPNGSTLAAANICNYPINTTLPSTGTYTIVLNPEGLTGSATIDPSNDITGTITVGTPLTTTINIPGQRALYTFSGIAGESLDLTVTNYSSMVPQGCNSNVLYSVLNPNGSTLASANICNFPIITSLPSTGTYTIVFNPEGLTGSATIDTSNDITGTITVGTPVTANINIPGQRAVYTLSGTAGELLSVALTNSTFAGGCGQVAYSLLDPNKNTLSSVNMCTSAIHKTLAANGTYTIVVNPQGAAGSVTVNTSNDITGTIAVGTPVTATINIPGQRAVYTLSGTAGELLSLALTNSTFAGGCGQVNYSLLDPNNNTLSSVNICTSAIHNTLAANGTYTIVVDPQGATGSLIVNTSNDITGTITVGTPVTATINIPGQRAVYTLSGTAGELLSVALTNSTFAGGCGQVNYSIINPANNSTLASANMCTSSIGATLPSNGNYNVLIDPQAATGSVTVNLTSP